MKPHLAKRISQKFIALEDYKDSPSDSQERKKPSGEGAKTT